MARTSMRTVKSGGDNLYVVTNYAGKELHYRSKAEANRAYKASLKVAAKRRANKK